MSDPVTDSVTYSAADSAQLRQLYAAIDQIEQQLAEREAASYAVVVLGVQVRALRLVFLQKLPQKRQSLRRVQPDKASAVQEHGKPKRDTEGPFLGFVSKGLLSKQCTRPSTE
jgi:hypothetical protein